MSSNVGGKDSRRLTGPQREVLDAVNQGRDVLRDNSPPYRWWLYPADGGDRRQVTKPVAALLGANLVQSEAHRGRFMDRRLIVALKETEHA